MKLCPICNKEKEKFNFSQDKSSKDGLKYKCKECVKIYRKEYNKKEENKNKNKEYCVKNKDKIKQIKQEYYNNNKEIHNIRVKKWRFQNKDKTKNYEKKYREKNKEYFKIKNSIFCRLWGSIKNKSKKNYKTEHYLGCSINDYKNYLENLFYPEMNWGNHGKIWEIDHIIPVSNFDLTKEEEIFCCFNYKNTQPLFKTTEISKQYGYGNKIGNRNKSKKQ
jgi:hypothetical protein